MDWENLTNEQKLFYFGGLIDGEGYIGLSTHGKGKRPVIQLQMTDQETVKKFANYFNLSVRKLVSASRIKHTHWKSLYHTRAECLKALPILKKLHPYLFLKKKACEDTLSYYTQRFCKVCNKQLEDTKNKKTIYCCASCRQKAKRQKKSP